MAFYFCFGVMLIVLIASGFLQSQMLKHRAPGKKIVTSVLPEARAYIPDCPGILY